MSNIDPKYLFNENVAKMQPTNVSFNMQYIIVASSIVGVFLIYIIYWLLSNTRQSIPEDFVVPSSIRPAQRTGRIARPQMRTGPISDDESGEDSDAARERIANEVKTKKKIGVKKMAKLEMKAEKKAAREAMLIEREEKKREEAYIEHLRKEKEDKEAELEREKEEAERIEKEERAKKEHEAYLELAADFEVEEEGFDPDNDVDSTEKLSDFINFICEKKVVLLEDLASQFKMKTRDVIQRIQALIENKSLTGIIDDRGKFISITPEELKNVAKFIKQRGRITVSELVENSNKLINLNPDIKVI